MGKNKTGEKQGDEEDKEEKKYQKKKGRKGEGRGKGGGVLLRPANTCNQPVLLVYAIQCLPSIKATLDLPNQMFIKIYVEPAS